MLITRMTPNVMARPRAVRIRIEQRLRLLDRADARSVPFICRSRSQNDGPSQRMAPARTSSSTAAGAREDARFSNTLTDIVRSPGWVGKVVSRSPAPPRWRAAHYQLSLAGEPSGVSRRVRSSDPAAYAARLAVLQEPILTAAPFFTPPLVQSQPQPGKATCG